MTLSLLAVASNLTVGLLNPKTSLENFKQNLQRRSLHFLFCCGSAIGKLPVVKPSSPPPDNWLVNKMPWARLANDDPVVMARQNYLEEKAAKYNQHPIALGLFGGVYNYNKLPWYLKKAAEADRPRIEAAIKETQPGVYDTRDWNTIREWAEELAKTVNSPKR